MVVAMTVELTGVEYRYRAAGGQPETGRLPDTVILGYCEDDSLAIGPGIDRVWTLDPNEGKRQADDALLS